MQTCLPAGRLQSAECRIQEGRQRLAKAGPENGDRDERRGAGLNWPPTAARGAVPIPRGCKHPPWGPGRRAPLRTRPWAWRAGCGLRVPVGLPQGAEGHSEQGRRRRPSRGISPRAVGSEPSRERQHGQRPTRTARPLDCARGDTPGGIFGSSLVARCAEVATCVLRLAPRGTASRPIFGGSQRAGFTRGSGRGRRTTPAATPVSGSRAVPGSRPSPGNSRGPAEWRRPGARP